MQISNKAVKTDSRITAVLGPTNTGKTHYAIERMASYKSGVIGFPLRLLARENYERLVEIKGRQAVALVTGEEKIIPKQARYFSCTVESMPVDKDFEFLGVDEIQLCADPERGHVFTDRLLRARGTEQTMFMGADTIKPLLRQLVPRIEFVDRTRLSQLTYKGFKKLTRMPKRSAIVAFSLNDVYAIAELVRRQRGGTAVVLGALSPRTRNKQVEMYQNGEVDFLVATDAIGMGLNMDIHHVALAATRKYDGHRLRKLSKAEIAQIAGRAGRYKRDGTFGVTGRVRELDGETVDAIENHSFAQLEALFWRNTILDFSNVRALTASLDKGSSLPVLVKGRPSDDYTTLVNITRRDSVMARAAAPAAVRLLWDVCQIPDFRQTLSDSHQELVAGIYETLIDNGQISETMVQKQLSFLDKEEGDVDTLMTRIAHIRTWTYITHKSEWLQNASRWQEEARAIEDRLSDALHEGLTKRFVDRRAAVLMRAMDEGGTLLAGVRANGDVVVEGHEVGKLEGFRFLPDDDASGADYKAVMAAARSALGPEIKRRLRAMLNAKDTQFTLKDDGQVFYQPNATNPMPGDQVARVIKGQDRLRPEIEVIDSSFLEGQDKSAIVERLQLWLKNHVETVLEALVRLNDEKDIEGAARGIAFQLYEALGILPRADLEEMIAGLDEAGRAALRARRVRMGPILVFLPELNKPAAIRLRALLWSLWNDKPLPASIPADGMTSISVREKADINPAYYRAIGYPVYGPRSIRVDMLDRVVCAVYDSAKEGKFQAQHKMAEWLGCPIADLYDVLEAMGHKKIYDPADEKKPEEAQQATETSEAATPEAETPEQAPEPEAPAAETAPEPEQQTEQKETQPQQPQQKPELATFALRKGKAYGGKKPARQDKPQHKGKKFDKPRGKKPAHQAKKPQVMRSGPKVRPEDSPFAVLQKLKK